MFCYEKGTLKLFNYQTLLRLGPLEVVIKYAKYLLRIKGKGLAVSFFERSEVHVVGHIETIVMEWSSDGE